MEHDSAARRKSALFRILAIVTIGVGFYYIFWRYGWSLNPAALWFSIPLILAETYSYIDSTLFGLMMWKPPIRTPLPPVPDATVDVFITTYNELPELVRLTAEAALRIDWEHISVYILDDGNRPRMKEVARELGCGYITRGSEWDGKPRHAKAGNVNNALMQTDSEYILILDADQICAPEIISRTIGYFRDPKLAFVQTPQHFYNLPPNDPFGSDAPLFYGPILQGKDGWNAAFFCGSNAILRREALLQLGLTGYVAEMEKRVGESLRALHRKTGRLKKANIASAESVNALKREIARARRLFKSGESLEIVSDTVRRAIRDVSFERRRSDLTTISADLADLAVTGDEAAEEARKHIELEAESIVREFAEREPDLGLCEDELDGLSLTRAEEAIPILPLATISVTEDMATALRLHALGWKSLYHNEILAYGLAPEDLGSALSQRLRWAQGTFQVLLRENPLFKKGLSLGQRLQYFTTMYSYLIGLVSIIYLSSPIIYLVSGVAPISDWSGAFFVRFLPFYFLNMAMFRFITRGIRVKRGQQYTLALFPIWIRAALTAIFGRRLKFVVTPKERRSQTFVRLVIPQIIGVVVTASAMVIGVISYVTMHNLVLTGLLINLFWGTYNIMALSTIIRAAWYKPPDNWNPKPPIIAQSGSKEGE